MAEVKNLGENDFDQATASGVVLVDFWAEWCGPCRMLGSVLEQVAAAVDGKAVVAKVNVDKAKELAKRFSVRSLPSVFLLKNGSVIKQMGGVHDKAALIKAIEENL